MLALQLPNLLTFALAAASLSRGQNSRVGPITDCSSLLVGSDTAPIHSIGSRALVKAYGE